eukprot:6571221-Prymnesium_polylepis.1
MSSDADADSWARLARVCSVVRNATRQHTSYNAVIDGCPVELFKWGTVDGDGSSPRLFLTLRRPNVSRSCNWKGGTTGHTWWYKVRIDPDELLVHTGDYTFARLGMHRLRQEGLDKAEGQGSGFRAAVPHLGASAPPQVVNVGEHTPFATCLDGSGGESFRAQSLIDLRGTPFAVESSFVHGGVQSHGGAHFTQDDQFVELSGGGAYGWLVSADFQGDANDHPGTWALRLRMLGTGRGTPVNRPTPTAPPSRPRLQAQAPPNEQGGSTPPVDTLSSVADEMAGDLSAALATDRPVVFLDVDGVCHPLDAQGFALLAQRQVRSQQIANT